MVFRDILRRLPPPAPLTIRVLAGEQVRDVRRTLRLIRESTPDLAGDVWVCAPPGAHRRRLDRVALWWGASLHSPDAVPRSKIVVDVDAGVDLVAGWLEPLLEQLANADVRAVAPLLVAANGTIEAMGFHDGRPWMAGLPVEDALGVGTTPVAQLGNGVIAWRPDRSTGALVVVPAVPARRRVPSDLAVRFTNAQVPPQPLWHTWTGERWRRTEGAPLRWAIKNPAPAGPRGIKWGDTHFARMLADALRGLGQEVVIDHRPSFDRETAYLDDVVVVLRGLRTYEPTPGAVNLLWVISHPDVVTEGECAKYDRVYAASDSWAERHADWGPGVRPLLQCTDPAKFHPSLAAPDTGDEVLFIGNNRGRGRPIVEQALAAGLPLTVYGADWGDTLPEGVLRSRRMPHHRVGAAYRAAGMVLGDHSPEMAAGGFISNRIFDAVAAGARAVSDPVVGIESVLPSVQVASTPADLAALHADHGRFGSDQDLIAAAEAVALNHTFAARARILVDDVLAIWAERDHQAPR